MEKEHIILTVLIALLVVAAVAASWYMGVFRPLNVLSVDKIEMDPEFGYEDPDTGEYKGAFWVVTFYTGSYGQHMFYKFNDAEVTAHDANTVDGKELDVTSEIAVDIQTDQPYMVSSLTETPYMVCKPCYASAWYVGWTDEEFEEHVEWDGSQWVTEEGRLEQVDVTVKEVVGDWRKIVPLTVTATKTTEDGTVTHLEADGQREYHVEAAGPNCTLPIRFENPNDPDEFFTFQLVGQLDTGQLIYPPDMAIFRDDLIFEKTSDLLNHIRYSTSNEEAFVHYWYGEYGTHWQQHGGGATSIYVRETHWPGVEREDPGGHPWDTYFRPREMYVYQDPPPIHGNNYNGLISYLEDNCRRLEDWEINPYGRGYEITEDEVKIYMDYDTWRWLGTLTISTDLADAYVWKPSYACGDIIKAWWASSGKSDATISDRDKLKVEVKNTGTVKGKLYVRYKISPSDAPLLIGGDGKFFEVGETHTFTSTAKNLGPKTKVDGEILIELVNDINHVCDTETVTFTLPPITGVTTLNVKVIDKRNPDKLLSGITISVQYGTSSDSKICNNGWATFSLGAYQGEVTVTAEESVNYQGATKTATVQTGGNTVTLELLERGAPPVTWWEEWWRVIVLAVIIVAVVAVAIWYYKREG